MARTLRAGGVRRYPCPRDGVDDRSRRMSDGNNETIRIFGLGTRRGRGSSLERSAWLVIEWNMVRYQIELKSAGECTSVGTARPLSGRPTLFDRPGLFFLPLSHLCLLLVYFHLRSPVSGPPPPQSVGASTSPHFTRGRSTARVTGDKTTGSLVPRWRARRVRGPPRSLAGR